MFIDYYKVLAISIDATNEDIKKAYREQSKKWHPDRNKGVDTKEQMQLINEANLILKDAEARAKYNVEYHRFVKTKVREPEQKYEKDTSESSEPLDFTSKNYTYTDYKVQDPELARWMQNAKNQSLRIVEQFFNDLSTLSKVGAKAVIKEMWEKFLVFLALGIIGSIIYMIVN